MYQSVASSSKRLVVAAGALALLVGATTADAAPDPVKCRRAIAKNAAGFEAAKIKALQKCEDGLLKGTVVSCPDVKATDKIAKAELKLADKVAKACTGLTLADMNFAGLASECTGGFTPGLPCQAAADCVGICVGGSKDGDPCTTDGFCSGGTCSGELQCDPVDKCPSVQNDAVGSPFPGGLDCYAPLTDAASVAACVQCVGEGTVDQLIDTTYGTATAPSADKNVLKCQRTLGKAAAKHFSTVRKARQKCQDGVLKGVNPGPCPDAKATDKIAKSTTKLSEKIVKACDEAKLAQGFIVSELIKRFGRPRPTCLDVSGAPADVAAAIECLTKATAEDNDALGVGSAPASANPLCGNQRLDAGETCDDGNQLQEGGTGPADVCPADCTIAPCTPSGTQTVTVNFTAGVDLTGLTAVLYYDESRASIPGANGDAAVQGRVTSTSFAVTPNDTNYALRVVLLDPFLIGVPSGEAFTVQFDTCQGAPAPLAADFACFVAEAGDASFAPVGGVSCSVSVP